MAGDIAHRDDNYVPAIQGVSSIDGETLTDIHVDPVTNRTLVDSSLTDGMEIGTYDYVSMALSGGDTTETYTFKAGGSGGTTVATVVVVYTTSDRDVLSSVTKT